MTKEDFCNILASEGFTADVQEHAWRTRPLYDIDSGRLRRACQLTNLNRGGFFGYAARSQAVIDLEQWYSQHRLHASSVPV